MLVSVIMSVYNGKRYLNEAIEPILNQTFSDFEFIIIDDGSTDGSSDVLKRYAEIDKRIVLVKNKGNIGLPRSLNKGIKIAKGKYIARQDADDISSLSRLEIQSNFAENNNDIDLIGSDCYIIDVLGDIVCINDNYSKIRDFRANLLSRRAILPHGSAFIKKDTIVKVGLYDPRFYYSQDGELWLRLIENGYRVHVLSEPLYYYRTLPSSNNKKDKAQEKYNKVKKMIYEFKSDEYLINQEILNIKNSILSNNNISTTPNYMALYWKNMANTAYFNKYEKYTIPYKYLLKALKEKNSLHNYISYIKLGLLYALPLQSLISST